MYVDVSKQKINGEQITSSLAYIRTVFQGMVFSEWQSWLFSYSSSFEVYKTSDWKAEVIYLIATWESLFAKGITEGVSCEGTLH